MGGRTPLQTGFGGLQTQAFGDKHPGYATNLNNLAVLYWGDESARTKQVTCCGGR